jgi:UDPglucose--hexose-1-phosphate uridylyltransferase
MEPEMELRRELLTAEMIEPSTGEPVQTTIEVRFDPLTGHSSRILPERGLIPATDFDLEGFARDSQPTCPFCPGRVDRLTPRLAARIHPDGRLTRGEAVLFANLHAYSSNSSVSVYSPRLHYLPLAEITQQLLADNLATQVAFVKAVMAAEPQSQWASINANHMLPSGSSLFHPHLQGIVDSQPTTMQRMLAEVPPQRFDAYLDAERRTGERYLGDTGHIQWIVSFAPIAPAELKAFIGGISSPAELTDELIGELAHGLVLTLGAYADMGFQSFNCAIYGAPPGTEGYPLNLRLACRSNLRPFYRSDSTFLERLHWEGAVDLAPESVARQIGERFRSRRTRFCPGRLP